MAISTREINKILSTEMDVVRRSARKSRMERIKNEHIKEIIGVKGKPDIIDIIMNKRLQWYGHVKRMPEERIQKLITDRIPWERRKRGRPRRTWMKDVQAAMTTRNLEPDQWRNREEWCLVSRSRRQLLKNRMDGWVGGWVDGWMDGWMDGRMDGWTDGWMECNHYSSHKIIK